MSGKISDYVSPNVFDGVRPVSPKRAEQLRERFAKPAASLAPAIAAEIYKALERLEADPELLSVIGSWHDTLSDEEVLQCLKDWNETGRVMQERQ